jgi:hypothetical protein
VAKTISITVKGMAELNRIPGFLDGGARRTVERGTKKIAKSVGDAAPHRSGALALSWQGVALTSNVGRVWSSSKYAAKIDRGAYVRARGGRALRFGGEFRQWVRFAPHPYVKKGLRPRARIMREAFAAAMEGPA